MKILIIKLGALGDVFRTTSLLAGIKTKYPDSQIYWITKKDSFDLLSNNNLINKVMINDENISKKIKNIKYDLVINLDEDEEACNIASLAHKKELIGFFLDQNKKVTPTETAKEWYNMGILGKKPDNDKLKKKNTKTYQELMSKIIGINNDNNSLNFNLTKEQLKFAQDFKRRYNISENDLVIGLNTGSGERWPSKMLSIEKTAELADRLYKSLNAKILLFGGPNEIQRNNEILSKSKSPIINSGCGNDLVEFPSLISICNVVITSDSLGLHLSLALKRKVVTFFAPTSAAEIEMYGLGIKIIPNHPCYCCYKPDCKAIDAVKISNILKATEKLLELKTSIIITSFNEPNLKNTIDSIINQNIKYNYEILVVSPNSEAESLVKSYKNKKIKFFMDPGKGKSLALNFIFEKIKSDILIFTDGDVILDKESINNLIKFFNNPINGVISGRVVSSNSKDNMHGYWSHLLADAGAHKIRKSLSSQDKFFECSAYLMGIRGNIINHIPLDVAEDSIIPYYFYKKGYKIKYAEDAIVYVKNPDNVKDWVKQRKRTAKAHETLTKYESKFPRVKSFKNEVIYGTFWALSYPKNFKEFIWTIQLFFARLYLWMSVFYDTKILKRNYGDGWERVESTK